MLLEGNGGTPVHFPKDNGRFEFDDEVALIFPNMAVRSIPLYRQAHALHASIAHTHIRGLMDLWDQKQATILDVGTSVGGFLHAICNQFQIDTRIGADTIKYIGTDLSPHMLEEFSSQYPWAEAICCAADEAGQKDNSVDVVCIMYVLQFVPPDQRDAVLISLYKSMQNNAIIFLGQKEEMHGAIRPSFNYEYIQWRKGNGYTEAEIAAKTRALELVMWPETLADTKHRLERVGFRFINETTRWLQFSTLMARK